MQSWDVLDDTYKESNRQQADHIPAKLEAIGCAYAQDPPASAEIVTAFDEEREVDLLAEMEHERYVEERIEKGWRFGTRRDNRRKRHPSLVPWAALSVYEQEKDRDFVRGIPKMMSSVGLKIFRLKPKKA